MYSIWEVPRSAYFILKEQAALSALSWLSIGHTRRCWTKPKWMRVEGELFDVYWRPFNALCKCVCVFVWECVLVWVVVLLRSCSATAADSLLVSLFPLLPRLLQSNRFTLCPLQTSPLPLGLCECILSYSECLRLHAFNPKLNGSTSQRKLLTGIHKSCTPITISYSLCEATKTSTTTMGRPCLPLCRAARPVWVFAAIFIWKNPAQGVSHMCMQCPLSLSLSLLLSGTACYCPWSIVS